MKKVLRPFIYSAAAVWLLAAAPFAQATVEASRLDVKLTIYGQGEEITNETTGDYSAKIEKGKGTNKELLVFIAETLNMPTNFPSGSYIEVSLYGQTTIKSKTGATLADASSIVQVNLDFEDYLFGGKYNYDTEKESSKIILGLSLQITGIGTSLVLQGVAFENFSNSGANSNGEYTAKGTVKAKVAGKGLIDYDPVFVEGTVSLKGVEKGNINPS